MASLPPASPGSDEAGGSASSSQDFGPTLEETRQELRLISPKISKCEAALESGGSYIGISDPVILLEQLKVLQRKDTQLREVLLILLRASPLHAPRSPTSPLGKAAALLPTPPQRQAQALQVQLQIPAPPTPAPAAAPATAPPPTAAIASALAPALANPLSRTPARRSSTAAEIQARRERARAAAAAAAAPTPAPVSALPSTPPSTSTAPPPYERSAYRPPSPPPSIPSGRTLSLHEALGLVPLAEAPPAPAPAVETSAGQPQGRPEVKSEGSGDVQSKSSLPSPKPPPTYFPGRHALYRASVPSRRVGTAAAASSRGVSSRSSGKSTPEDFVRHEAVNGHAERRQSLEKAVASGSLIEGSRSSGEKTSAPVGIKASVAAATVVNPSGGGVTPVAEGRTGGFAPAVAGVGHGVTATPVDAAVGGSNDDQAKVRELAEVATAFDRKIGAGNSSSPVPAPSSGKEISAGSNATKLEDDDTRKETAIENRGPYAGSDGAATASDAVGVGAVRNSSRDSSSPSGIAAKAVVKTCPISAKSVRSPRNNKRKTAPRPGLRVSTRRTRASTNAMETAAGVVSVRSPVAPSPADAASTGTTVVKAVVKSSAEVPVGSAGTKSSRGKCGSEGSHTATGVGEFCDNQSRNRKRRKSAETGGWRSRYNAEEFELGELNSSSMSCSSFSGGSDTESDEGQPREAGSGKGGGGDSVEWDEILVDVGGEDGGDGDGDGVGDGGGVRRVKLVRKRDPPNAWKRRCADGTCLLGASFGYEGKQAVYCSAHKDAGMVNVTHRRCEEPRCLHQPSFNMEGERKALYCRAHKRDGMVNVSAPRCDTSGCMVRPSFGFLGDKRATLCDAHKKPGMLNVRRRKVLCSLQGSQALPTPASIKEDDREGKKETISESRPEEAAAPVPAHLAQDSALPVAPIPTSTPIMSCVSAPSVSGSGSDGEGVDVGGAPVSIVGGAPREEGIAPMEVVSSAS